MVRIGSNIRKLRELKSITREQMASQLDMSPSNYSKVERDELPLTLDRLEKIAKIFELTYLDIINYDESKIMNFIGHISQVANSIGHIGNCYFSSQTLELEKKVELLEKRIQVLEENISKNN